MADSQVQRTWKEHSLLSGNGSRVTHYILSDTAGNSLVAVVGTERTLTNMYYYISEQYLRVFGCTETFNAGTRDRTRKDAIKWLDLLKENEGPIFANPSQQIIHETLSAEHIMTPVGQQPPNHNGIMIATEASGSSAPPMPSIMWVGDGWTCSKPGRCLCTESSDQLKHYPAFTTLKGTNIAVYSFVLLIQENKESVAYIEDLYENQHGVKMVKIRWFQFPKEPSGREIFMTRQRQEIHAESVISVATILTPNHFRKCSSSLRSTNPSPLFLCHREINKGQLKPFYLSQLHGYSTQTIIASLIGEVQPLPEGELTAVPETWSRSKFNDNRAGSSTGAARPQGPEDSFPAGTWPEPIKRKRSHRGRSKDPLPSSHFKVNDKIEFLSQDSGIRGCWFRCNILRIEQTRLKAQHCDVLDADENRHLVEWIASPRIADPDQLGTRLPGRLTVRPCPSQDTLEPTELEIGSAVDAFDCDGWWEGLVIDQLCQTSELNTVRVYAPAEKRFLAVDRRHIRASKDWIDGKWVNIKPKHDILSYSASLMNPMPELQPHHDYAGTSTSASVIRNLTHSTDLTQGPEDSLTGTSWAPVRRKTSRPRRFVARMPGTSKEA